MKLFAETNSINPEGNFVGVELWRTVTTAHSVYFDRTRWVHAGIYASFPIAKQMRILILRIFPIGGELFKTLRNKFANLKQNKIVSRIDRSRS